MRRLWNTFRYGDSTTKMYIGRVVLFSVLAIGCIIASGIISEIYLFIAGMFLGIVAIFCSQTFTLEEDDFVAQVDKSGRKESVRAITAKKTEKAIVSIEKRTKMVPKDTVKQKKKEQKVDHFEKYNKQVMKKVKKKHHVKKDHRPIIIDYSKSYHIKECPAFIWRVHSKVYILLLEKEPRKICISRDLIRNMGYAPKIRSERGTEYQAFEKDNLVTSVFRGYLPDYYDTKEKDKRFKYKNLYTIYPDIQISNRCAYEVMDLLCLNFMPKDKITESEKINGYFKRIYAANILFRDRVYSITEYKNTVETVLKELCYAEMPRQEFRITLENLVSARLISKEYEEHYMDFKDKIEKRKQNSKK